METQLIIQKLLQISMMLNSSYKVKKDGEVQLKRG